MMEKAKYFSLSVRLHLTSTRAHHLTNLPPRVEAPNHRLLYGTSPGEPVKRPRPSDNVAELERPIGRIRSCHVVSNRPTRPRETCAIDRGALQAGNVQQPARASKAIFVRASEPTIDRTIRPVNRSYQ